MSGGRNLNQPPISTRAAAYYRMSTDTQLLSIDVQTKVIEEYCTQHNITLVKVYADEGRSGLTLKGRPALTQLLGDVRRNPDFEMILVYDISRWGRFQDADEGAYYEFSCRRHGVPVVYCAETFAHDANPMSAVLKAVKRVMAAEYSRELSTKVFLGQCRHSELGFRACGATTYGLRRMVVGRNGQPRGILDHGEQKAQRSDRITLVPGPADEVEVVRRIFGMYVKDGMPKRTIAAQLNAEGIRRFGDSKWNQPTISRMLENPSYAGHIVYFRSTRKLKTKNRLVSREHWVWARNAIPAIIAPAMFEKTQRVIRARSGKMAKEDVLVAVKRALKKYGRLSQRILDADDELPSQCTIVRQFGSFTELYRMVGYMTAEELLDIQTAGRLRFQELRRRNADVRIPKRTRRKSVGRDPEWLG